MFENIRHSRIIALAFVVAMLLIMVGVGAVIAETKSDSTWIRTTQILGDNAYSQTTSTSGSVYYLDVNLRAWGSAPNPLKEEDNRYCYNCTSTSNADVSTLTYGPEVARHNYVLYSGGGVSYTDYTSNAGGTASNASCWACGIVYC